jgi:hypothetical protein
MNSRCGSAVAPALGGIDNRPVPRPDGSDTGYLVTVVPKRRETLTQAAIGKYNGQFFLRSGSGFYTIPHAVLGELFGRRPSPLLTLELQLEDPSASRVAESVIEAEARKRTEVRGPEEPYGRCVFEQSLVTEWHAFLKNEGLASADQLCFAVTVLGAHKWSILKVNEYESASPDHVRLAPWPATAFTAVQGSSAAGMSGRPTHPGQQVEFACGQLVLASNSFQAPRPDFQLDIVAYAKDCPSFRLSFRADGASLADRYRDAFLGKARPAVRDVPEPRGWRDRR